MTANERRMEILDKLLVERKTTLIALQNEFRISRSTAKRDIQELSCSYPIVTAQGNGGGIRLVEGYKLGMKYMSDEQTDLLERLAGQLVGTDYEIMRQILKLFSKPKK